MEEKRREPREGWEKMKRSVQLAVSSVVKELCGRLSLLKKWVKDGPRRKRETNMKFSFFFLFWLDVSQKRPLSIITWFLILHQFLLFIFAFSSYCLPFHIHGIVCVSSAFRNGSKRPSLFTVDIYSSSSSLFQYVEGALNCWGLTRKTKDKH